MGRLIQYFAHGSSVVVIGVRLIWRLSTLRNMQSQADTNIIILEYSVTLYHYTTLLFFKWSYLEDWKFEFRPHHHNSRLLKNGLMSCMCMCAVREGLGWIPGYVLPSLIKNKSTVYFTCITYFILTGNTQAKTFTGLSTKAKSCSHLNARWVFENVLKYR